MQFTIEIGRKRGRDQPFFYFWFRNMQSRRTCVASESFPVTFLLSTFVSSSFELSLRIVDFAVMAETAGLCLSPFSSLSSISRFRDASCPLSSHSFGSFSIARHPQPSRSPRVRVKSSSDDRFGFPWDNENGNFFLFSCALFNFMIFFKKLLPCPFTHFPLNLILRSNISLNLERLQFTSVLNLKKIPWN